MCPLYVLAATMSSNESDRIGFVTARCLGDTAGDLIAALAVMPIVLAFGLSYRDITGWRIMALIIGAAIIVFGVISFLGTKERVIAPNVDEHGEKLTFAMKVQVLRGNKPFWRMFLLQAGYDIAAMSPIMLFSYFCIHCLGRPEWVSSLLLFATAGQILAVILSPRLAKRLEKRTLIFVSCALTILSWIFVFTTKTYAMMAVYNMLRGAANGLLVVGMGSAWPDICDYTEWKYNKATPGFVMSVAQCGNKIGIGVASYIITAALALIGYQETAAAQTAQTLAGLRILMIVLPLIGVALIASMNALLPQIDRKSTSRVQAELAGTRT